MSISMALNDSVFFILCVCARPLGVLSKDQFMIWTSMVDPHGNTPGGEGVGDVLVGDG